MKSLLALSVTAAAVACLSSAPASGLSPRPAVTEVAAPVRFVSSAEETSCKIEFVGPGEKCGDYGTCPETAHRSFLWGLIEYDTEIVLCWCLVECDISL